MKQKAGKPVKPAAPITDDPRFNSMHNAPTFKRIHEKEKKFKVDPRFKAVLTDDRFRAIDGKYDKYGKKLKKSSKVVDDLKAFYTVDDEEDEEDENEDAGAGQSGEKSDKGKKHAGRKGKAEPQEESEEEDEEEGDSASEDEEGDDEEQGSDDESGEEGSEDEDDEDGEDGEGKPKKLSRADMEDRLEYLNRLARGEVSDASVSTSDSSSEEDSSDEEVDSEDEEGVESRRLEEGAVPMGEATRRLAVLNCDWEHVKAVDLLGILQSFKPSRGVIQRVTVYVSDFGKERMAEEERLGPAFLRDGSQGKKDSEAEVEERKRKAADVLKRLERRKQGLPTDEEEEGGEDFDPEQLRQWELQKLRYYFAVAEFDTTVTASAVYEQVDGIEFEYSSVQIDARFVPDDTSFEGREVRDKADHVPSTYEPTAFVTKALQHSKVECTWDAGDEEREAKLTSYHKWAEMDDDDLAVYLASSSEGEEDEEEEESEGEEQGEQGRKGKGKKEEEARRKRAMLLGGLLGDAGEEDEEEEDEGMEVTIMPGKTDELRKKMEAKAKGKAEVEETAWEAMQRRRKEKRREKKAAKLAAKNGEGEDEDEEEEEEADDFFMETTGKGGKKGGKRKREGEAAAEEEEEEGRRKRDAELELLFAGEDQEENARDFDMKELQRQERLKGKKLKGKRRRKEEAREPAPGQEFVVDTQDSRFTKLFEGNPDFGLDPTSKEFKATEGMKTIQQEQTKRRKKDKKRPAEEAPTKPVAAAGGAHKKEEVKQGSEGKSLSKLVEKFKKPKQAK